MERWIPKGASCSEYLQLPEGDHQHTEDHPFHLQVHFNSSTNISDHRNHATSRLESLQKLQEDGIEAVACDVTAAQSVEACRAAVIKAAGAVHVLVNNAGA